MTAKPADLEFPSVKEMLERGLDLFQRNVLAGR